MIINVYKPKDWTSFDVVRKLKGALKIKKMGHAGTLDPLAEGVLIILTGKDTKKQAEIMAMDKEYVAEIAFGAASPTYDLEGEVVVTEPLPVMGDLQKKVQELLPKYTGEIDQTVPAFSAKKVQGVPMYLAARKGMIDTTALPTKKVTIKEIKVDNWAEKPIPTVTGNVMLSVLSCTITCGKGTYVRSIAHDLGQDLGVGGVLVHLVRTRVGDFTAAESRTVSDLLSKGI